MRFHGQVRPKSRSRRRKRKLLPLFIPAFLIAIVLFFYTVNAKLTPIYTQYAEVQTHKIAAHVISKAINSRTSSILDVNDIIVEPPEGSSGIVKFDAEIISRAQAEIQMLVESHLTEAEAGNMDMLQMQENIQFDPQTIEGQGGIVFYVPMGQALNLPILGNLGPKIPIRFHVIGEVQATIDNEIKEFGINNAMVIVYVQLTVNVQIIVPLATRQSIVQQKIPVAMGLIQSKVPHIYTKGEGDSPSIEIPVELPDDED